MQTESLTLVNGQRDSIIMYQFVSLTILRLFVGHCDMNFRGPGSLSFIVYTPHS